MCVCVSFDAYCSCHLTAVSRSKDKMGIPGCRVRPCWEVENLHTLFLDKQWKQILIHGCSRHDVLIKDKNPTSLE